MSYWPTSSSHCDYCVQTDQDQPRKPGLRPRARSLLSLVLVSAPRQHSFTAVCVLSSTVTIFFIACALYSGQPAPSLAPAFASDAPQSDSEPAQPAAQSAQPAAVSDPPRKIGYTTFLSAQAALDYFAKITGSVRLNQDLNEVRLLSQKCAAAQYSA